MTSWPRNAQISSLLTKYQDLVLWDAYHRVKALLLYPCGCAAPCTCEAFRERIILSLNLKRYLQAKKARKADAVLQITRLLLHLPEPSFWEDHFCDAYPLWLMDQRIGQSAVPFQATGRLVWMLLRIGEANENFYGGRDASIRKSLEILLGTTPLKFADKPTYLCGEKGYEKHFKTYRAICPLVAAYEYLRGQGEDPWHLQTPQMIRQFFGIAAFVRRSLLTLTTINIRGQRFFTEEGLLPMPSWVDFEETVILEPLETPEQRAFLEEFEKQKAERNRRGDT